MGNDHDFPPVDFSASYEGPLPEIGRYARNPTPETHDAAAKLLHRTGALAFEGRIYSVRDGKVISEAPPSHPVSEQHKLTGVSSN